MILQRLKRDTRSHHEQIEDILDLPTRLRSRDSYRSVLVQFYGFYAPVEAALDMVDGLSLALDDVTARWKTALIADDLGALGVGADALNVLPRCADLPRLPDVAHAFGCLYVLEGATLGGQVIARQIFDALDITGASGGAFFAGYGSETGLMWRTFGAKLSAYATTPEREASIIAAATQTFGAFAHWLAEKR